MPGSNHSLLDKLTLTRLSPDSAPKQFDCGDDDLNEFFRKDAAAYGHQLLAVTYVFENDSETAAFFSVLNDKISYEDVAGSRFKRVFLKRLPERKRLHSYPAVKVGRLGVNLKYKRQGLGSDVLTFVKHFFTNGNKTGCRFITVDAYNCGNVITFYQRNGFEFLTKKDEGEDTRQMYFDLINFRPV